MKTLRLASLLCAAGLQFASAPFSPAQQPALPAAERLEELELVLVTGEVPGPALWRVTRGNNTLWILPLFGPLPYRVQWRSREVAEVIRNSQAVYVAGRTVAGSSPRSAARALRALMNGDGKLLLDTLPADLYQRFTELGRRHVGSTSRFELYRPYYATELLREAAMHRLGLASDGEVVATVTSLARRHDVKVHAIAAIAGSTKDRIIAQLDRTPRQADVPCVRMLLDRMEQDLRESVARANAWSRGDLAALRGYPGFRETPQYREACAPFLRYMTLMNQQEAAARRSLYSTYAGALRRNRSTLALVWVSELLGADGLIARFRGAGYDVIEPR